MLRQQHCIMLSTNVAGQDRSDWRSELTTVLEGVSPFPQDAYNVLPDGCRSQVSASNEDTTGCARCVPGTDIVCSLGTHSESLFILLQPRLHQGYNSLHAVPWHASSSRADDQSKLGCSDHSSTPLAGLLELRLPESPDSPDAKRQKLHCQCWAMPWRHC